MYGRSQRSRISSAALFGTRSVFVKSSSSSGSGSGSFLSNSRVRLGVGKVAVPVPGLVRINDAASRLGSTGGLGMLEVINELSMSVDSEIELGVVYSQTRPSELHREQTGLSRLHRTFDLVQPVQAFFRGGRCCFRFMSGIRSEVVMLSSRNSERERERERKYGLCVTRHQDI